MVYVDKYVKTGRGQQQLWLSAREQAAINADTMKIEEFRRGYVDADYPGLEGYVYQGEFYRPRDGKAIMEDILKGVEWIEDNEMGPILYLHDGSVLYARGSDDFPQPTDERLDVEEFDPEEHGGRWNIYRGERVGRDE